MIEELIKQYVDLKIKEDEIKAKKEELSDKIKEYLITQPDLRYDNGNVKALLVESTRFSYTDKVKVMTYLKSNKLNNYIKEVIDEPALNKAIKESDSLSQALSNMYNKTIVESLKVEIK